MTTNALMGIACQGTIGYVFPGKNEKVANALYFATWAVIKVPFSLLTSYILESLFKPDQEKEILAPVTDIKRNTHYTKEREEFEAESTSSTSFFTSPKKIETTEEFLKVALTVSLAALTFIPIAYLTQKLAPHIGFDAVQELQQPILEAALDNTKILVALAVFQHLLGCIQEYIPSSYTKESQLSYLQN